MAFNALLPAYRVDPNPFAQGFAALNEGVDAVSKRVKEDRQRMAMVEALARTPGVGLAQAESLAQVPEVARNALMQYSDPMLPMRKNQAEADLSMVPLRRQQIEADLAMNPLRRQQIQHGMAQQDRMFNMQAAQLKNQSPEGKAEIAVRANLVPGSPEFNEFVYGIKRPDPLEQLLAPPAAPRPAGPPAAMSPTPSMPGPRLIPQSAPVEQGDPNLIKVQAPGAGPQQPAQEPIVTLPGGRQVLLSVAEAFQLRAASQKNEPLANLIGQAIGKVPKALQDDVDKMKMQSIDQIGRLEGIKTRFKPEWQTWETSLKQRGLNIADSFEALRDKIPEAERKTMADYAAFKMEAIDNLNRYIKEMTGAAMSEVEAKRLRQAMPDPDKDSPTQFKAKLENSIRLSKLTHARYVSMGRYGVSKYTPVEAIPDVINQRANDLERQLRQQNPQAAQPLVDKAVKDALKQEFGI